MVGRKWHRADRRVGKNRDRGGGRSRPRLWVSRRGCTLSGEWPRGPAGPESINYSGGALPVAVAVRRRIVDDEGAGVAMAWVFDLGIIRPETNGPHGVHRAGFSQILIFRARKVIFLRLDHASIWCRCQITRRFASPRPQHGSLSCARLDRCVCVCLDYRRRHDEL